MANTWFRMYSEFASDPKVQMLSETDQRRLTMIFCLRCNGHVTLQDEEVTFLLRISNESWQVTKALFISKGFINSDNEVLNWDKRQYVSDSSAERVARHRAKKKDDVTPCNVTVTPPEQIQNRTDTEQIQKKQKHAKATLSLPDFIPHDVWESFKAMRLRIRKPMTMEAERLLVKDLVKIKEDGFDPVEAINNSIKNSWQGIFVPKSNISVLSRQKSKMDISGIDYKQGVNADGSF